MIVIMVLSQRGGVEEQYSIIGWAGGPHSHRLEHFMLLRGFSFRVGGGKWKFNQGPGTSRRRNPTTTTIRFDNGHKLPPTNGSRRRTLNVESGYQGVRVAPTATLLDAAETLRRT